MALHGFAHLVGMVVSWQLAPLEGAIYKTTLLSGRVDVGDAGMRVMGALWLLTALGFAIAAFATYTNQPWWLAAAIVVSVISLALSIVALPDSRIGVGVNLLILAALGIGTFARWI
jgi:hypothetical protein